MSAPMQFLLCDSAEHAEVVDHLIMERLRDEEKARGASWSGVFTDGSRFVVLWASPASALFGQPFDAETGEGDPELVVVAGQMVARDAEGEVVSEGWELVKAPAGEQE